MLWTAGLCSAAMAGTIPGLTGLRLIGTGGAGALVQQGYSVALSADGNTALVGGPYDNTNAGATWVYTRSGGAWTQQGTKLVGAGAAGAANQGYSVALSADGNTALVGGWADNSLTGAAWVFVRSGNTWTQQGSKLVGTGATGNAYQGYSVALSADGNTALVGGPFDSPYGAAWVYTRSAGVWTQQGSKLVGTGATGGALSAEQGYSVALSADGNTALVGGPNDSANAGAAWVYTRSAGVWTQQGSKLVGTGATGGAQQGGAVALSADGNTALIGGWNDNTGAGAAWVHVRSGSTWAQQGSKLVGIGGTATARQGWSVALSADGNTALVGAPYDNPFAGAAWVFARSAGTWLQGSRLVGAGGTSDAQQGQSVALSGDGSTVLIGGPIHNGGSTGAAWVFGSTPCTIDLDGNGSNDALTDGLILLRALFGLTGNAVTSGTIGSGSPTRTTWAQLQPYMNGNCGGSFLP